MCKCKSSQFFDNAIRDAITLSCMYHTLESIGGACECEPAYSIESHGPQGEVYALYYGRCNHKHGLNLATISDVETDDLIKIEDALNLKLKCDQVGLELK